MESADNLFETDDEVKKLQELVKKLEKQNEVLRSKQKVGLESVPNGDVEKSDDVTQNRHPSESASNSDRSSGGGFDDVDVLDVDNLSLKDEEDSWLYSSPKPPTPQQNNVNILKWMRQDFDHPSPELESARRTLLFKLNEVAKMNRSSSTPSLGSNPSPTKPTASLSRSTEESQKPYTSRPHQKQSLLAMPGKSGSRLDNGTFTRPKKSHERPGPVVAERDRGEDEAYHSLEGSTDVEKLARQQEESLRQSLATYTSPKRVIHNKTMSVASDTDNSGSPMGSNRSSPAQYDPEGSYMSRHRNSFGSDNGTPPDSPRTVQQHSTPYYEAGPGRRSLPTNGSSSKSRLQYPQPASHSSDSSLDHQSAGGSMDDLNMTPDPPRSSAAASSSSRLPGPGGYRAASPAMVGLRPGMTGGGARGMSPQRSGLPTPKRAGIPRPSAGGVRSSLPTPRRSGIPSPRPTAQGHDESWRDGCF